MDQNVKPQDNLNDVVNREEKSILDPDSLPAKIGMSWPVNAVSFAIGASAAVAGGMYFGFVPAVKTMYDAAIVAANAILGGGLNMGRKMIISDYYGIKKGYFKSGLKGLRDIIKGTADFTFNTIPKGSYEVAETRVVKPFDYAMNALAGKQNKKSL